MMNNTTAPPSSTDISTTTYSPLIVACFHVLWSKDCIRSVSTAKELASSYPHVRFLSIAADTLELDPVARRFSVTEFPTFILFRGGKEVGRCSGNERVSESLVGLLTTHVVEDDVKEMEEREKRKREAREKAGLPSEKKDEMIESTEIEWVWDVDAVGGRMKIEELGMMVELRDDEDDTDVVVWEYAYDESMWGIGDEDPAWTMFEEELQDRIEAAYKASALYKNNQNIEVKPNAEDGITRGVTIWKNDLTIRGNLLKGLRADWIEDEEEEEEENDDDDDEDEDNYNNGYDDDEEEEGRNKVMVVRRRGPRLVVEGETLSEQQKRQEDMMAKRIADAKTGKRFAMIALRGKDVEAARGTSGLTPNSGMHRWTLRWDHEPARGGGADAVGVVSENFESYGPMEEPCLGGDVEMASIGFYASGKVYQGRNLVTTSEFRRSLGVAGPDGVDPWVAALASARAETNSTTIRLDNKVSVRLEGFKESEAYEGRVAGVNPDGSYDIVFQQGHVLQRVRPEMVTKLFNMANIPAQCWGRDSLVTVVFDTDTKGGVLTFEVNGVEVRDVRVENVFNRLGGGPVYPAICMCPLAKTSVVAPTIPTTTTTNASVVETTTTTSSEQDTSKEDTSKSKKEEDEEDQDSDDEEEEGTATEKEEENKEEAAAVVDDDPEKQKQIARAALLEKAKQLRVKLSDSELASKSDKQLAKLVARAVKHAAGPKFPSVTLTRQIPLSGERHEEDKTEPVVSTKMKKSKKKKRGEKKNEAGKGTSTDPADEEIPLDRCVWMWETPDEGWQQYPKLVSLQLEQARRNNKQELQIRVGGRPFVVRLVGSKDSSSSSEPEQKSDTGETHRVRRHVVAEGLRGQWELLSLKFLNSTKLLRGAAVLELLKRVWSESETMSGRELGQGFLFLYTLLQGQTRVKVVSSWNDYSTSSSSFGGGGYFGMGGFGGGGGGGGFEGGYYGGGGSDFKGNSGKSMMGSNSSDSHRFAILLAQLYADRRTKSLCNSVVNVLTRNKQLCTRMPKLKDTRKIKKTAVFNGWVDERESRSPLAELFSQIVPVLQDLKKKRGTIQFPPKPPHPQLASPPTQCKPILSTTASTRGNLRPELSDSQCEARVLSPITKTEAANLAVRTMHRVVKWGNPPIEVEEDDEFDDAVAPKQDELVVVLFHAKWCSACETLSAVFRATAMRTPSVQFVRVNTDFCEKTVEKFKVDKLPHTVYIRQGQTRAEVMGGGPKWVVEFDNILGKVLTKEESKYLDDVRLVLSGLSPPSFEEALTANEAVETLEKEVQALSDWTLEQIASSSVASLTRAEMGYQPVDSKLAFDISGHEVAGTAVAQSMLARLRDDSVAYADSANKGRSPRVSVVPDSIVISYFEGGDAELLLRGRDGVRRLLESVRAVRECDVRMVATTLPLLLSAINYVDISTTTTISEKERRNRIEFLLRRRAGREPEVWAEFLFGALLSSDAPRDLSRLNPYASSQIIDLVLRAVALVVLRSSRVGHASRCVAAAIKMEELLDKALLLSSSVEERKKSRAVMEPRLIQAGEALAGLLSTKRHYVDLASKTYDPRFMVFEFVWNLSLRKKQIEIVQMFRGNLAENRSKVKQMIMGAGKTTVVAPLLALMLADGKSLVLSVVPKALLEMSRTRMRETFAAIMNKRIYTLRFDRSTRVQPSMRRTLENAVRNRGVVVATPTTVKSIMLSYMESLEHLDQVREGTYKLEPVEVVSHRCAELAEVLRLFRSGVMLLDEVDLLLHPLKSELNFPKGDKFDLDVSEQGERWGLPVHLLDAIFFSQTGRVTAFESRGAALDIIKRLASVVEEGYKNRSFQRLPHITLLNPAFYQSKVKPIMAEWAFLWLQKQHLHGVDREEAIRYMLNGAAAKSEGQEKERMLREALLNFEKGGPEHVQLSSALEHAERARVLTDALYQAEEEFEAYNAVSSKELAEIEAQIASVTKLIKEAEFPRDDSLDNAVVVWFSHAFAPSHAANAPATKLQSIRALGSLCSELESNGLTVKRCDTHEEAAARVRELQSNGHLRCVILGGGEGIVGCGPDCEDSHDGICLTCGGGWGQHSGHQCSDGRRGSWPEFENDGEDDNEGQDESVAENIVFARSLMSSVGQIPLPSYRICVFGGHATLVEASRKTFWNLSVFVAEDDTKLQAWADQVPDWKDVSSSSSALVTSSSSM